MGRERKRRSAYEREKERERSGAVAIYESYKKWMKYKTRPNGADLNSFLVPKNIAHVLLLVFFSVIGCGHKFEYFKYLGTSTFEIWMQFREFFFRLLQSKCGMQVKVAQWMQKDVLKCLLQISPSEKSPH